MGSMVVSCESPETATLAPLTELSSLVRVLDLSTGLVAKRNNEIGDFGPAWRQRPQSKPNGSVDPPVRVECSREAGAVR